MRVCEICRSTYGLSQQKLRTANVLQMLAVALIVKGATFAISHTGALMSFTGVKKLCYFSWLLAHFSGQLGSHLACVWSFFPQMQGPRNVSKIKGVIIEKKVHFCGTFSRTVEYLWY